MSSPASSADTERLELLAQLRRMVESALEGKPQVVELTTVALLARGHILLEDVPGVGKTTLARAISKAAGAAMRRVQFTSDLLPSDLLGVSVWDQQRNEFVLRKGPVFTHVLLADEINRATPRTQSALLEAMSEGQVSIDGESLPLPKPFLVLATQNPQDFSGTFPLPESQLDRFMVRLSIGYPPPQVEARLILEPGLDRVAPLRAVLDPGQLLALQADVDTVSIDHALATYMQALVAATRSSSALSLGASPRAAKNLAQAARARALLQGRDYCIADDVQQLAVPLLAHRVRVAAHADGYATTRDEAESVLREVMARVPVPL